MLPIGDDNWDRRRWPVVTALFIVANAFVFVHELQLQTAGERVLEAFVHRWGMVPREYSLGQDLPPLIDGPYWMTLFTSLFVHGGWLHLLGNMLYLWIFGDNVEDRLGRIPFVLLFVGAGAIGSLAQMLVDPSTSIPAIGASGAVSGVLGVYFLLFPRKRVRVLFFFIVAEVPAVIVIGLWALTQLSAGLDTLGVQSAGDAGGVAYMAHVGGFATGLVVALIVRIVRPVRRPPPPRTLFPRSWRAG